MDATPPSMAFPPRQTSLGRGVKSWVLESFEGIERWLEAEREQVPLWVPIGLGVGIAGWFLLPDSTTWVAFCCLALALALLALLLPAGSRIRGIFVAAGILSTLGCILVWGKASLFGEPPLARATFATVTAQVMATRPVPAEKMVRVILRPVGAPDLPTTIRVNMVDDDVPPGLGEAAVIRFRVRLMPPAPPAVPGGYDFAARAYFQGIGATGKALRPIEVLRPSKAPMPLRTRLFGHILDRVEGPAEGIAAALATGDQGAIGEADAEAMRRSGLAHLLSISGLHVTALIGAVIFLLMRIMALSSRMALNLPLMLIAASGGALGGIGYTLLTGAEVPTVRSCIAALLALGGLALGREAITLRLVATGALVVLVFWPEALVGPSFQMSFAAVTAIVALAEHRGFRALVSAREEAFWMRLSRALIGTLLTGFAVELVLIPIALFHFHKAGMLGAFANLLAIPLTTFVVMPLEALALLLDLAGLGAPFWWLTEKSLDLLLWLAHWVSASPMASFASPTLPRWMFALMMGGLLWWLLWRTIARWWGLVPLSIGAVGTLFLSSPDILIMGDGRHVAIRTGKGMALLRDGAGDYVRDTLAEGAGYDGTLDALSTLPQARCSIDLCAVILKRGGRRWRILMTRSSMMVDRDRLMPDCAVTDIVISDRNLPRWCRPRWLKIDKRLLAQTGGLAIDLDKAAVQTVREVGDSHPWIIQPRSVARPPMHRKAPRSIF